MASFIQISFFSIRPECINEKTIGPKRQHSLIFFLCRKNNFQLVTVTECIPLCFRNTFNIDN